MKLLIPFGLLGLLSIIALILIYIIKPNYQQKMISSSYVWKLSLKLKKKRIPVSKLRNLLLFLCQILALVSCALILAQPALVLKQVITRREVIAIIDSSASMRAGSNNESRFERAVGEVMRLTDDVFDKDGIMTVLVADKDTNVIAQRSTAESRNKIEEALNELVKNDSCSYGSSDIDSTMAFCENIISDNPNAQIYLYTDTSYSYIPDGIEVVNVSEEGEWNVGILNAYAVMEDNYYSVFVDLACYGRDESVDLSVEIYNANAIDSSDVGKNIKLSTTVACDSDKTKTVVFRNGNFIPENYENAEDIVYCAIEDADKFYSYQDIHISIDEGDSFSEDDNFDIYNGQKHVLKVQYASSDLNGFFGAALEILSSYYSTKKDVWDIQIKEVKSSEAATSGFDFYIFEHVMPVQMPTDGVVFLCDLTSEPSDIGITLGNFYNYDQSMFLTKETEHPLLENISCDKITLTSLEEIRSYDPAYQVLLSCDTKPVLLAKDDEDSKVIIAPFSLHYSNVAIRKDFVTLMFNIFEYYFPATVVGNSFEVYESVAVNARGPELKVTGSEQVFTEFPAVLTLDLPGTYTLMHTTYFGALIEDRIYVKIPASESNIYKAEDAFRNPFLTQTDQNYYESLLTYFAAALVALLFIEWLLQARDM